MRSPKRDEALAEAEKHEGTGAVERPSIFTGVTRNVFVVGVVSLLTDISSEMTYPILPLFLVTVLKAPPSAIGLIEGIAESTASILKIFSGWLSDRLRRRKALIAAGYGLSNLVRPVLFAVASWPQVLAIRFADRVGKGVRTSPRDAVIADSAGPGARGRAFGFHRAMDTIGAAIGPLAATAILLYLKGPSETALRTVFLVSAIPGVLAVVVLAVFLIERRPETDDGRLKISFKDLPGEFRQFALVVGLFTIGNSSDAFLILRAQNVGVAIVLIPLVYFVFNIVHAIFAVPAGALSDRFGRRRVIAGGYAVFALIYLGFALANRPLQIWLLFAVYGFYYAATDGVQRAFVGDLVPSHLRATALGAFNGVVGLLLLPASVIGGVLWQRFGPSATFFYGAAFAAMAAVGLLAIQAKE